MPLVDIKAATTTHGHCSAGHAGMGTNSNAASHRIITTEDWKKLISSGFAASAWRRIITMLAA